MEITLTNIISFLILTSGIIGVYVRINERLATYKTKIQTLEKQVAVSDEKFKQIFEKLDKIILILDKQADRIPNFVWGVAGAIFSGVIMWLIK